MNWCFMIRDIFGGMKMECPKCGSEDIVKNGTVYVCMSCMNVMSNNHGVEK